ncbi:MAG: hypothetical protein KKE02_16040 [Alphaproteobacteria bacterium]|nr:hypothetical protein [Alphaproteobacteria bacterium]MBU1514270.1 hypothetical protein [Alphaproteobacteria bacterium]MBU2097058.1 hypothetical protein [Alphaproteobacteria bacterium]MBU2152532.1 hypothetical protein [Alphaproteobacteria bacterium]MBU2308469.1 hypothetical protein [Alphaproteobacteria bacterium]
MKAFLLSAAVSAALCLGGCQKANEGASVAASGPRGRYVGVGIYAPGQMWSQLVRPATPAADPAAATFDDDEQVIVVLDSATGELRQCGNLSGHCIGLNPWAKPLAEEQGMPAALVKHAQQLETEVRAEDAASARPHRP